MTKLPIRLCRIVTVPITFKALFQEQLRYLAQHGFEITLVSSSDRELAEVARYVGARYYAIEMVREPSPWRDLRALIELTRWLRRQSFDVIHSSTPKAGLLAAVAGWFCHVPARIHTYTGQVWVEMHGPGRAIVKAMDVVIGRCATQCLADSASQRQYLIEQSVIAASKLSVLGSGSVAGVDLDRFDPVRWADCRTAERTALNIAPESRALIYVGRLRADKGLNELVAAFQRLQTQGLNVDLLLVGPVEYDRQPLLAETLNALSSNPRIHVTGYTPEPERYLSVADLFVFPSYREGFGSSVIEAAAMGLPAVATRVTGCMDSVIDGQTGLLVPAKDAVALTSALAKLVTDDALRQQLGRMARARAVTEFDARLINQAVARKLEQMVRT